MKYFFSVALLFITGMLSAQQESPATTNFDTVYISALRGATLNKLPFSISTLKRADVLHRPLPQLMQQLALLPSVSSISSGGGINKPVIRGLSFNQIQLFGFGTRMDNQTWDDRHDLGIAGGPFTSAEVIGGPAAILYGPNTMGGALIITEKAPDAGEKTHGYVQTSFFGNSRGGNLDAGLRSGAGKYYYALNTSLQAHTNYMQGGGEEEDGKEALAFNSKYTNVSAKGMVGYRGKKSTHQINYGYYKQLLGIVEDEEPTAGGGEEERDYEMEAPYQDVQTQVISSENKFFTGKSNIILNLGYQANKRKEFEPGETGPKSKDLAVALNLKTVTADLQWQSDPGKASGINIGLQAFHQRNENFGNAVLVPDAKINTVGAFALYHFNTGKFNLLAGARIDAHEIHTFETPNPEEDTLNAPYPEPEQALKKNYTPFSFSVGAVYHISSLVQLKLNIASGYAAPNYAQLTAFGRHEGSYRFEIGENNLKMSKNLEADLALVLENSDVKASLKAYDNMVNDYIYINPTGDSLKGLKVYRWAQHDAVLKGLELELTLHPQSVQWLEVFANGGVMNGKLKNDKGYLPYIPSGKLITGFTVKGGHEKWQELYATIQFDAYGAQKNVANYETTTAGYFLTDLYLGGRPPIGQQHRWSAVVFCTNLFNKAYFNHSSLIKSIGIMEPGRNLGLALRYGL
jgi:iron complex outermembrane recepter protein